MTSRPGRRHCPDRQEMRAYGPGASQAQRVRRPPAPRYSAEHSGVRVHFPASCKRETAAPPPGSTPEPPSLLRGIAQQKIRRDVEHIIPPRTKRRKIHPDHMQAIVEILPEASLADFCHRVAIGCADDAHINRLHLRRANRQDRGGLGESGAAWAGAQAASRRSRPGRACRHRPRPQRLSCPTPRR